MKKLLILWAFACLGLSPVFANDFSLTLLSHDSRSAGVGRFEKIEFGLQLSDDLQSEVNRYLLSGNGLNPYNPDQVSIVATFTGPDGTARKAFGFYMEPHRRAGNQRWEAVPHDHKWRVRFAPDLVGNWTVNVSVTINQNQSLPSQNTTFNCVNSPNPGYVIRGRDGSSTDRYLRYSGTGETFFVIGENMVWADFELKPAAHQQYRKWITELSESGGNFARLGLISWEYGIEWEQLGNYQNRQNRAWELDQIIELCEQKGVYLDLLMNLHGAFRPKPWDGHSYNWETNPYHAHLDGVEEPVDFFTNEDARRHFKHKLRYHVARWGYSTSVAVWELLSEIDESVEGYHDDEGKRAVIKEWFREMREYIRTELDDQKHMVSGSYAVKEERDYEEKIFPVVDICFSHNYGYGEQQNYDDRYDVIDRFLTHESTLNAPALHQEMGGNIFATIDICDDITFHNALWATSLSGGCGAGLNWWWDYAIHKHGQFENYKALKAFFEGEQLSERPHVNRQWKNRQIECYILVDSTQASALGWVHNRSYWWANLYDQNSCVKQIIDDNSGVSQDPSDRSGYAKHRDNDRPIDYASVKIKLRGLRANGFLRRGNYVVEWYRTSGNGGLDESAAITEAGRNVQVVKTSFLGNLRIPTPPLNASNPDWGFKIRLAEGE